MLQTRSKEYSPYKMLVHLPRLMGRPTPVFVQWDITNVCNLRCSFCTNRNKPLFDPMSKWDVEDIYRTAISLRNIGVKAIELTGGGEPTLHPAFEEIVTMLSSLNFELGLITNGTRLNAIADLAPKFLWMRVSLDAARDSTYRLLKGKSMPDLSCVKELNCRTVGASFIIVEENVDEIGEFALFARELGFHHCRYSLDHDLPTGEIYIAILGRIREQWDIASSYATSKFGVFPLKERINIWKTKTYSHCYYADLMVAIDASGEVYRCCEWKGKKQGSYGNLFKEDFVKLWEKRKPFHPRTCPPCWMDQKNEIVEQVISSIAHVNFV